MKIVKTLLKVIAGVFLLAVLVGGYCIIYLKFFKNKEVKYNSYYTEQLPVEPSFFSEDFKEIHQTTLDNYSLYQAKQLNMDSLYRVFSTRLQREVTTKAHYGKFLQEYFAALNSGTLLSISIVIEPTTRPPILKAGSLSTSPANI